MSPVRARRLAAVAALFSAGAAHATCNAIPSAERGFPSTLGEVSTPFARPGQRVAIRRDAPAFAADLSHDAVRVTFRTGRAPDVVVDVAPTDGAPCTPDECAGTTCRCIAFVFPDSDASVGAPDDGDGLTGPAAIEVTTDDATTAMIDGLVDPDSRRPNAVFPSFTALPARNAFRTLTDDGGHEIRAAVDVGGNLLIPFDLGGVALDATLRVLPLLPIIEAQVPGLHALGDVPLASFTSEGRRLPVTAVRVGDSDDLLGTADGTDLVLWVGGAAARTTLERIAGGGPVVIGGVSGWADPRKRADANTLIMGPHYWVYENPECSIYVDQASCEDLNGDGDTSDHFLRAFDATVPRAEPAVITGIDERDIPGAGYTSCPYVPLITKGVDPGFPPYRLYDFTASDELVQWSLPETGCFDLNDDGQFEGLIADGAFDLRRTAAIDLGGPATHREVAGSLLAFTRSAPRGHRSRAGDWLFVYDAGAPEAGIRRLEDRRGRPFVLPVAAPADYWGFSMYGRATALPLAFAVSPSRVAFEVAHDVDLDGNGDGYGAVLALYDARTRRVRNLHRVLAPPPNRLRLTDRWLLAELPRRTLGFYTQSVVGVFDVAHPGSRPRIICDDPGGYAYVVPTSSDELLACVIGPGSPEGGSVGFLNNGSYYRLTAFLPDAPGGGAERRLALAVGAPDDVQISGATLAVGVMESAQCDDLDGDGEVGGGFLHGLFGEPYVLHAFNGRTGQLANLRADLVISREPAVVLAPTFLGAISPEGAFGSADRLGTSFWDLAGDGNFGSTPTLDVGTRPAPGTGACATARDCADGNVCTTDACVAGHCVFTPRAHVPGVACALGRLVEADACGSDGVPRRLRRTLGRGVELALAGLPLDQCGTRDGWRTPVFLLGEKMGERLLRAKGITPACRETLRLRFGELGAALRASCLDATCR